MNAAEDRPSSTPPAAPVYAVAPAVQVLWLISGLIGAVMLTGLVAFFDFRVLREVEGYPLAPGQTTLILGIVLVLRALIWPPLSYRAWRFSLREHDVWMRYGVLWRTRRSVPRVRIQHVDVESGPLERLFGLANLVVYTAGTGDADARIPGLRIRSAEWMRDALLPTRESLLAQAVAPRKSSASPTRPASVDRSEAYGPSLGAWPATPSSGLSDYVLRALKSSSSTPQTDPPA
jgi:membrane protein YdbS with pleckstrin-like domain